MIAAYRVAVRPASNSTPFSRAAYPAAGCQAVNGLALAPHLVAVQAYSDIGASFISLTATPGAATRAASTQQVPPPPTGGFWRCLPTPGSYPYCGAVLDGRCRPLSYEAQVGAAGAVASWPGFRGNLHVRFISPPLVQARAGGCNAPWMRTLDQRSKMVIQYCSDFCSCELPQPGNGTAAAPAAKAPPAKASPGKEPAVRALAGPPDNTPGYLYGGGCKA